MNGGKITLLMASLFVQNRWNRIRKICAAKRLLFLKIFVFKLFWQNCEKWKLENCIVLQSLKGVTPWTLTLSSVASIIFLNMYTIPQYYYVPSLYSSFIYLFFCNLPSILYLPLFFVPLSWLPFLPHTFLLSYLYFPLLSLP